MDGKVLDKIGSYFFGIGGIGDALILLSTFMSQDYDKNASVIFWANDATTMREFFGQFQHLGFLSRAIIFQGWQKQDFKLLTTHPNFRGKGHIPDELDYVKEWSTNSEQYLKTIHKKEFGNLLKKIFPASPSQHIVGIGVQGSNQDSWKRKSLNEKEFHELIDTVLRNPNDTIRLFGSGKNRIDLPIEESDRIQDLRGNGFSFTEINECYKFISTDTWYKTYTGFIDTPTLVIRSEYLRMPQEVFRQDTDPADAIFLNKEFWGQSYATMNEFNEAAHYFLLQLSLTFR